MLDSDAFQLKRMMRQDAHEKAFEMHVLGQREYEASKELLIKEHKKKLDRQYGDELAAQQRDHKIAVSH